LEVLVQEREDRPDQLFLFSVARDRNMVATFDDHHSSVREMRADTSGREPRLAISPKRTHIDLSAGISRKGDRHVAIVNIKF